MLKLEEWEENWQTNLGIWDPGKTVYIREKDVFDNFPEKSWMDIFLYSITGKSFSDAQVILFNELWALCGSFPDPRLWNNRMGSLAGTVRASASMGIASGTATGEALVFGQKPVAAAAYFLVDSYAKTKTRDDLVEIVKTRLSAKKERKSAKGKNRVIASLPGFGRPITRKDERFEPVITTARNKNLVGKYTEHLITVEDILKEMGSPLRINIAILMVSLLLDQGLTQQEVRFFSALCFTAGIQACQIDAEQKPEGCFLPLRCDRIQYIGEAERDWLIE